MRRVFCWGCAVTAKACCGVYIESGRRVRRRSGGRARSLGDWKGVTNKSNAPEGQREAVTRRELIKKGTGRGVRFVRLDFALSLSKVPRRLSFGFDRLVAHGA